VPGRGKVGRGTRRAATSPIASFASAHGLRQLLLEPVSNLDEFCCWPLPDQLKARPVNQFVRRISALLLFGLSTIPVRAANPDLSSAPLPNLSQTAWRELEGNHTDAKEVTLLTDRHFGCGRRQKKQLAVVPSFPASVVVDRSPLNTASRFLLTRTATLRSDRVRPPCGPGKGRTQSRSLSKPVPRPEPNPMG
jgi:hypothetical protein